MKPYCLSTGTLFKILAGFLKISIYGFSFSIDRTTVQTHFCSFSVFLVAVATNDTTIIIIR